MKILKIPELNQRMHTDPIYMIAESEQQYNQQLTRVALDILKHRKDKPILLLSGPSGSGKTTSALRIEQLLEGWGCAAMVLSMDNYYLPESETPQALNEHGVIDYESPYRLDIPLLSDHLAKLSRCEPIQLPVFNFAKQCRETGQTIQRKPDELVILEGIHALNPEVTGSAGAFASCIYVSVRTRLQGEDGTLLHPSKIRLMRRLMRDRIFRGREPVDTFRLFESVSRGEHQYIMPFKHRAAYEIDTFIDYEASVYRSILLPDLLQIADTYPDYARYADIAAFLQALELVPQELVPGISLVREFIGGSTFHY